MPRAGARAAEMRHTRAAEGRCAETRATEMRAAKTCSAKMPATEMGTAKMHAAATEMSVARGRYAGKAGDSYGAHNGERGEGFRSHRVSPKMNVPLRGNAAAAACVRVTFSALRAGSIRPE
jgi:hypothetical protein